MQPRFATIAASFLFVVWGCSSSDGPGKETGSTSSSVNTSSESSKSSGSSNGAGSSSSSNGAGSSSSSNGAGSSSTASSGSSMSAAACKVVEVTPATDGAATPTFATVKAILAGNNVQMACASAQCHASGGTAPPPPEMALDLTVDDGLYQRLTTYRAVDCNNNLLVDPCQPALSALVDILSGPCMNGVPQMPRGCSQDSCVSTTDLDAIADWIADGAPQQ